MAVVIQSLHHIHLISALTFLSIISNKYASDKMAIAWNMMSSSVTSLKFMLEPDIVGWEWVNDCQFTISIRATWEVSLHHNISFPRWWRWTSMWNSWYVGIELMVRPLTSFVTVMDKQEKLYWEFYSKTSYYQSIMGYILQVTTRNAL